MSAVPHGTNGGYTSHGCRCDACRSAHAAYEYRARRQRHYLREVGGVEVEHGTVSTYTNWGCRCDACTAAMTARSGAKARRRREQES